MKTKDIEILRKEFRADSAKNAKKRKERVLIECPFGDAYYCRYTRMAMKQEEDLKNHGIVIHEPPGLIKFENGKYSCGLRNEYREKTGYEESAFPDTECAVTHMLNLALHRKPIKYCSYPSK